VALDYEQIFNCLEEVEQELLRVGEERCDFLQAQNQLSVVILLLLRAASLFRSMAKLLRSEEFDAFDAVRRAFLESWHLAFQFRMENKKGEIGRWLARTPDSWRADIGRLEKYAKKRRQNAPNLGHDYGELSELAHPIRSATENSAALTIRRLGMTNLEETNTVEKWMPGLELSLLAMLYRLLWLVLDEGSDLLPLHVNGERMPLSMRFVEEYTKSDGRQNTLSSATTKHNRTVLLSVVVGAVATLVGLFLYGRTKAPK
jgi:hypothetical protein